jgi:hypothetical protein
MVPAYVEEHVHKLQQQITELEEEIEVGVWRPWACCLLPGLSCC